MSSLTQLTILLPAKLIEEIAVRIEDEALVLTVIAPPRQDQARIEALFADAALAKSILAALQNSPYASALRLSVANLPPRDWLREVARATPPRQIDRLTIHGAHDHVPSHKPALLIEAATAFGTGEHPSTQMCLRLLQLILRRRHVRRVLDMGCGSGILALAAARLARAQVLAVDHDAESIRMTHHNARTNGLQALIEAKTGDGYDGREVRAQHPYDLIFANIFARPLVQMAPQLKQHVAGNGYAILAGLLTSQMPMVMAAHRIQRLKLVKHLHQGEWSALLLQRQCR
jgi:ribosomal protein L11 methyltransferase